MAVIQLICLILANLILVGLWFLMGKSHSIIRVTKDMLSRDYRLSNRIEKNLEALVAGCGGIKHEQLIPTFRDLIMCEMHLYLLRHHNPLNGENDNKNLDALQGTLDHYISVVLSEEEGPNNDNK